MSLSTAFRRLRDGSRSGKGRRAPLPLVFFLFIAPCLLLVLYSLWSQTHSLEDAVRVATEQLQVTKDFLSSRSNGAGTSGSDGSVRDFAARFDSSLGALERHISSIRNVFPISPDLTNQVSRARMLWTEVHAPLLQAAEKPGANAQQEVKLFRTRIPAMMEPWEKLAVDADAQKQVLQRWLLCAFAATSILCLLMLYSGMIVLKSHSARLVHLIDTVRQRAVAQGGLNTASLVSSAELATLPRSIEGVTHSVQGLIALVEESFRRTETLLDGVPAGLLVVSSDLCLLYVNRSFFQMFPHDSREVIGKSLGEVLPIPSLQRWARLVLDGGASHYSVSLASPDERGSRFLRVTFVVIKPEAEPQARLLMMLEDETEVKTLRDARDESERRYQAILQNVVEGVLVVDEHGCILDINPAGEGMVGYTKSEVVSKPLGFLMPETSPGGPAHQLLPLLSSGKWKVHGTVVECTLRKKHGVTFPAEVRLGSCPEGARQAYTLSLRDMSEHKRAESLARDRFEVIEMIAKNRSLTTVLTSLSGMLERQLPGSLCAVMMRRNDRLYTAAAPSLPDGYVRAVDGMPIGPSAASCGTAAFTGRAVTVSDIVSDPLWNDYRELALRYDLRSSWSVPIHSSDGLVVGTIDLYNREPKHPEDAQIELIQTAARLAAVSIEQRQLTGRLAYQAQHDALTGLPNRLTFEEQMRHAIGGARQRSCPVGLLSIDLDRFKLINDSLGHAVGDALLQEVAGRIRNCVRKTDIVARWGGDEFMVGLTELKRPQDASLVAQKLLDAMRAPLEVLGHELFISATIGIGLYPEDGSDLAAIVRSADRAMYGAKTQGRNSFRYHVAQDDETASQRLEVEYELRRALDREELLLYYQPQFDLGTCQLVALEALLRWNSQKLGSIPPSRFIPIAEETGLIIPIGSWVIEQVCNQLGAWQKAGYDPVRVAVNVSTLQFARPDFVEAVARTLVGSGIQPRLLELEMTESLVMRNVEESTTRIANLKDLGVGLAIDDFGTGYSSLSYLQHLPIDTLKIDQSFVRDIADSAGTLSLVQSIVSLAKSLGMRATAEGVESQAQFDALRPTGCHLVQGYLLGRPMPLDALPSLLHRQQRPRFVIAGHSPQEDPSGLIDRRELVPVGARRSLRRSA